MFARLRGRQVELGRVEFCDSCTQVSTPASRAQALRKRTRTDALYRVGMPR